MLLRALYVGGIGFLAVAFGLLGQALLAEPAEAGSPWTGCYIGAGAGYTAANTTATEDIAGFGTVFAVDGLGAQGVSLSPIAGCDVVVAPKVLLGIGGSYAWDDVDFSVSAFGAPGDLVNLSLENRADIFVRAGYLVTPQTLAYLLVGYTQAQTSDLEFPAFGPAASLPVGDLKGWEVGGGLETDLGNHLFLQGQATWAQYDKESIDLGFGESIGLETDMLEARVSLLWKLNVPEVTAPFEGKAPLK